MAKFGLKLKAEGLRKAGMSVLAISKKLGVAKSTASLWCRGILLTKQQRERLVRNAILAGARGRLIGAERNRDKKNKSIQDAKLWAQKKFFQLSTRDLFIAGIALYWAEGSKSPSSFGFNFVNSDPNMISFMYRWLREIVGVRKDDLHPGLAINEAHKDRERKVSNYWSHLLDLPTSCFRKPVYIKVKQKKVYSNHDSYYGVMRLKVAKSTILKYKVLALIDLLRDNAYMSR